MCQKSEQKTVPPVQKMFFFQIIMNQRLYPSQIPPSRAVQMCACFEVTPTPTVRCVHSHCRDSSCAVEICRTPVLSSTPILKCHKGGIVFGPRPEQTVLEPIMFGTVLEPIMFGKVSLVTTEGLAGR